MTLDELRAAEKAAYYKVTQIEKDLLDPAKEAWRVAYRALAQAEDDAKIEEEVQRRLAAKEGK